MPGQVGPGPQPESGGGGSGTVTGSGTTNTVAKFTTAGAVGNSQITDDGDVITAGQGGTTVQVGTVDTVISLNASTEAVNLDGVAHTVSITAASGLKLNAGTGLTGQTGSGTSIVTNTAPTITGLTATGTTLLQLPIPVALPGTNLEGEIQGRSDGTLWYGSDANTWAQVNTANTVITVAGGGTGAATFTANGVLYGNTTSALQVTAQGAANSVLIANAGAPSFSQAPIINTSVQLGVVSSATGQLKLANSGSANLTTIQAGAAAAARTYTWPTNFGAAGTSLTDAAGDGTLSWAAGAGVSGANPSASVGLAAVNGVATTYLRSDGAPALDQAIVPTWTGSHVFSKNAATSLSAVSFTGTPFLGTGTTSYPVVYINSGAAPSTLDTGGSMFVINAPSAFGGALFDVHANGGVSLFKIASDGTATGGNKIIAASGQYLGIATKLRIQSGSDGIATITNIAGGDLTRLTIGPATTSFGAIARVATNGLTIQDGAGTSTFNDASTAGSGTVSNRYIFGVAAPTLTATNASVTNTVASTFYIGGAPTDSTNVTSTAKYAVNIDAGLVRIGGISTDAGLTDTTVCQDTTTHALYAGSGAVGICLGTSSRRYKEGIREETDGLSEVLELQPVRFRFDARHGDGGVKEHSGFTAEDIAGTKLARLVDFDKYGRPNAYDWSELFPVLVNSIKELYAQNQALNARLQTINSR